MQEGPKVPPPRKLPNFMPRVLAAQVFAFGLILLLGWGGFALFGLRVPIWSAVIAQGLCAAAVSHAFGLRGWWLGGQCALPVLAWAFLSSPIPAWAYLAVFLVLALIYSNTSTERVPLYLSNRTTWAALSEMIAAEKVDETTGKPPCFVDLGCGLGGTIAFLSTAHPNWVFVGVENAPGPYLFSRLRLLGRTNARVEFKNLWDVDLADFDVVYAFLSPAPMPRLIKRALSDMKPGAVLISNSFWAPDQPYDGEVELNDGRKTCLFYKRIEKI